MEEEPPKEEVGQKRKQPKKAGPIKSLPNKRPKNNLSEISLDDKKASKSKDNAKQSKESKRRKKEPEVKKASPPEIEIKSEKPPKHTKTQIAMPKKAMVDFESVQSDSDFEGTGQMRI